MAHEPTGGDAMRLIHRHHRGNHHAKAPRVSITQAEITADLLYPAGPRPGRAAMSGRRGGGR